MTSQRARQLSRLRGFRAVGKRLRLAKTVTSGAVIGARDAHQVLRFAHSASIVPVFDGLNFEKLLYHRIQSVDQERTTLLSIRTS
jgi:hypothetical protein